MAATVAVAMLLLLSQTLLSGRARTISEMVAPCVTTSLALLLGAVSVVVSRGAERRWRLLMCLQLLGFFVGAVIWVTYRRLDLGEGRSPDLVDLAYLMGPVVTVLSLLCIPASPPGREAGPRAPPAAGSRLVRDAVVALDSLLIVGSMLLIAWVTILDTVTSSGAGGLRLLLAIAHPLSGTMVVVVLLLLITYRRIHNGRMLVLLAIGLLAATASQSTLVYLAVVGPLEVGRAAFAWLSLAIAPLALALATLVPGPPPGRPGRTRSSRPQGDTWWVHVYLPYLPLGVAAGLDLAIALREGGLRGVTLYLSFLLPVLVTLRQMVTLAQNSRLVARLRAFSQRLEHQAMHDSLTGLPNRALFGDRITEAVEDHRERGRPLVLLFCDLDEFKAVNDTLGHAAGDDLLRAVAGRLRAAVRAHDLTARLGGDEFAVLIEDAGEDPRHTGDGARRRVLEAMAPPFHVGGQRRHVHVSVGLAYADGRSPARSAEELLHRADQAMYAAKDRTRRARLDRSDGQRGSLRDHEMRRHG
ncbi:GGDEF domain-containing protein [Frankia sp. CNm7]|uniref:GGDEF domain-containing protein n=1 Tax=Frankia nepalensis TaxID=1836974 RepID=A0A937RSY4_9ACTN|nr:GGDEF domain-containing protein [Frankia nepalensis]MBL7500988.1 GGDEF domain-containing protein [Frankia nepalensis]MBL7512466.1 GGDEF domain-containing protein [Frankia nepalensis]MBL7521532.1 GGDEF domain-containing protein [Frankia nepalensis]MBL7632769.1 GGDEF domain-containing protein [Frankia nepalensis]